MWVGREVSARTDAHNVVQNHICQRLMSQTLFIEGLQFSRPPGRAVYMHTMRISALVFEDSRATMCAGLKIIELGAGCGWLGMSIARNLPLATVCMTEMEEGGALEHLEYNLALNPLDNVSTAACDWALWQACASDLFIYTCV